MISNALKITSQWRINLKNLFTEKNLHNKIVKKKNEYNFYIIFYFTNLTSLSLYANYHTFLRFRSEKVKKQNISW